jgi:hypothetical protein
MCRFCLFVEDLQSSAIINRPLYSEKKQLSSIAAQEPYRLKESKREREDRTAYMASII